VGLKVAMISPWKVRCGIASYSESLAEALAQLGVDVYIVRYPRFGLRTPELIESMVLDKIPVDRVDLIHHQNEYGLLAPNLDAGFYAGLKRLGKPIVVTMHAVGDFTRDGLVSQAADRVIVHNTFCLNYFQGDRGRAVVIPHGCKPRDCPPRDECKRSLGIDPRVPIVGYLGFISPAKGLETLIEAMRGIPEAALLVAGGWFVGEETDYIMRLKQWSLQALPGRCQWLGYVPDERLATVYGAMDIVAYCNRWMTESGALLMALSYGKAVICSDLPPAREKAKRGALVTFKDAADLRRKIKQLLKDDELRSKLEEEARRYAEENKWYPSIAEKHLSLYLDVLKNREFPS
jgi:glycosyltransferase involved in cell wall biosynthesis